MKQLLHELDVGTSVCDAMIIEPTREPHKNTYSFVENQTNDRVQISLLLPVDDTKTKKISTIRSHESTGSIVPVSELVS